MTWLVAMRMATAGRAVTPASPQYEVRRGWMRRRVRRSAGRTGAKRRGSAGNRRAAGVKRAGSARPGPASAPVARRSRAIVAVGVRVSVAVPATPAEDPAETVGPESDARQLTDTAVPGEGGLLIHPASCLPRALRGCCVPCGRMAARTLQRPVGGTACGHSGERRVPFVAIPGPAELEDIGRAAMHTVAAEGPSHGGCPSAPGRRATCLSPSQGERDKGGRT